MRDLKSLKQFITKSINKEPEGNFCWYNMWPKLNLPDKSTYDNVETYVRKRNIKYLVIVNNVEEARPQRTGLEPEFYRPSSMMRIFSDCTNHNNAFVIAFWGLCWGEEWDLSKIKEGLRDFPDYSHITIFGGDSNEQGTE